MFVSHSIDVLIDYACLRIVTTELPMWDVDPIWRALSKKVIDQLTMSYVYDLTKNKWYNEFACNNT